MIRSMTGFASRDVNTDAVKATMTLRSYNNRYLDILVSLPPQLAKLEPGMRDFLSARIARGKVECQIRVRELAAPVVVRADLEAESKIAAVLESIRSTCGLAGTPSVSDVASFPGVVTYEREPDESILHAVVLPELELCFSAYEASRIREGEATRTDILRQTERLRFALGVFTSGTAEVERSLRTQYETRFREIAGGGIDESRMLAELAVLLVKFGINEECCRLSAHLDAFEATLATEDAPGKKLDFVCQEMNREINTIGSKNMLYPLAQAVVDAKDALENIREQLRNIE